MTTPTTDHFGEIYEVWTRAPVEWESEWESLDNSRHIRATVRRTPEGKFAPIIEEVAGLRRGGCVWWRSFSDDRNTLEDAIKDALVDLARVRND